MRRPVAILVLGSFAMGPLVATLAAAQDILLELQGKADDAFVLSIGIEDLDGDGVPDLVTSGEVGPSATPELRARSGRDGSTLWSVGSVSYGLAALGDVDGDGTTDLLSTEPFDDTVAVDAGAAYVRSGRDGSVLRATYGSTPAQFFGMGGAAAHDIDADGIPDYLVRWFEPNGKPAHVVVCAGADGSVLLELSHKGEGWATAYAGIGDTDGDGRGDFAVGEPGKDVNRMLDAGRVHVYSGRDGALLYRVDGTSVAATFGRSIASAHDVDGDGALDFLVGAPVEGHLGRDAVGTLYVVSGVDGHILRSTEGELEYDLFGETVAALGDVNGDGVPDYGATAGGATYGGPYSRSAYLFSGATGAQLRRFDGRDHWDSLDFIGDAGGDLDGDGLGDLLLSFRDADPATGWGNGRLEVRAGNDLWVEARPQTAAAGQHVDLITLEGVPHNPTVTAIVAINTVPTFVLLEGIGNFKMNGARRIGGVIPPGLSGVTLDLRAWALGPTGVIDSAVATFIGE